MLLHVMVESAQKKVAFFALSRHFHPRVIHKYFINTTSRKHAPQKNNASRAQGTDLI
jgi:hypothetical protein